GHLQPPATSPVPATLFIRLGASAADGLTYNVVGLVISGAWKSISLASGKQALNTAGSQMQFVQAAIVAQANVIAIRLGTRPDDTLLGVAPATFNRLGGNQWGQFVAGQAFAELVAAALNKAVDDIVSSDPNIELLDAATGAWLLPQRLAIASSN